MASCSVDEGSIVNTGALRNSIDMIQQFVKVIETILSATASLNEKIDAVITGWEDLNRHYVPDTFSGMFDQLYAATCKLILKGEWFEAIKWNNYKNGDKIKRRLMSPLNEIMDKAVERFPLECKMCHNLKPFLDKNPWSVKYIDEIILSKDFPDPKVVESLLEMENKHLLELRLECLCSLKMYPQAFNIAQVCYLESKKVQEGLQTGEYARNMFSKSKFADEITNIFYLLLCRLKLNPMINKYLNISEAVEVVSRLTGDASSSRIAQKWKEWKKACKTIINVTAEFVLSQVDVQVDVKLVKTVFFHWIKHAGQEDEEIRLAKDLLDRIDKINADHVYAFADVIVENFGTRLDSMQKALELYIRAMTYDINQIEKLDVTINQSDKKREFKNKLAERYLHLATLFSYNEQISWELTLTAFSLSPSQHLFDKLFMRAEESTNECLSSGSGAEELRTGISGSHISLKSSVILTNALSEDLQTVIQNPRWKSLCWAKDKVELENLCRQQLDTGGPKIKAKEDLKHLHINYDEYKPHQTINDIDLDYGFEKGYEPKALLLPRRRGRHKNNVLIKTIARKTYPSYPTAFNKRGRKKFGITRPALPKNKVFKNTDSNDSALSSLKTGVKGQKGKRDSVGALASHLDHLQRYRRRKKRSSQIRDEALSLKLNSFLSQLTRPSPTFSIHQPDERADEPVLNEYTFENKENMPEVKSTLNFPGFTRYTSNQCISAAEHGELNVSPVNIPNFNGFHIHDLERLEGNESIPCASSSSQNTFLPSPTVDSIQHARDQTDLSNKLETDSYLKSIKFRSSSSSPNALIDLEPVVVLETAIPEELIEDSAKSNALDVFIKILQVSLKYLQKGCYNPSISPTLTAAIEQSKMNNRSENLDAGNSNYKISSAIIPQIISEVCQHESGKFSQPLLQVPTCPINYFRVPSETSNVPSITRKPGPKRITRKLYTQQMVQQASKNLKNNINFKGRALGLEFVQGHLVRSNKIPQINLGSNEKCVSTSEPIDGETSFPVNFHQKTIQCPDSGQLSEPNEDPSISSVGLMSLDKYIVLQSIANIQFDHPTSDGQQSRASSETCSAKTFAGTEPGNIVEAQGSNSPTSNNISETQEKLPNSDSSLILAGAETFVPSSEESAISLPNEFEANESVSTSTTDVGNQQNRQMSEAPSVTCNDFTSARDCISHEHKNLPPAILSPLPEAIMKVAAFIYGDFYKSPYCNRSLVEADGKSETEGKDCSKNEIIATTHRSRAGPRSKTRVMQNAPPKVYSTQVETDNECKDDKFDDEEDAKDDYIPPEDAKDVDYIPPEASSPKKNKRSKRLPGQYNPDQHTRRLGVKRKLNSGGLRKQKTKKQNDTLSKDPIAVETQSEDPVAIETQSKDPITIEITPVVSEPKPVEIDNDALENHGSYKEGSTYLDASNGYFNEIETANTDLVFECSVDVSAEGDNFWEFWPNGEQPSSQQNYESWDSLCGWENPNSVVMPMNKMAPVLLDDRLPSVPSSQQVENKIVSDLNLGPDSQRELSKHCTDDELLTLFQCKPCKVRVSKQEVLNWRVRSPNNDSLLGLSDEGSDHSLVNSDTSSIRKNNPRKSKVSPKSTNSSISSGRVSRSGAACKSKLRKTSVHSSDDEYDGSPKKAKRKVAHKIVQKCSKKKRSAKTTKKKACPKSKKKCVRSDTDDGSSPDSVEIICLSDSEPEHEPVTEIDADILAESNDKKIDRDESLVNENAVNSSTTFEHSPVKEEGGIEVGQESEDIPVQEIENKGWTKLTFNMMEKNGEDIIELSSGDESEEDPLGVADPLSIDGKEVESSNPSPISGSETDKANENEIFLGLETASQAISFELQLNNQQAEQNEYIAEDPLARLDEESLEESHTPTSMLGEFMDVPVMENIMRLHHKHPYRYVNNQPCDTHDYSPNEEELQLSSVHIFDDLTHETPYPHPDSVERSSGLTVVYLSDEELENNSTHSVNICNDNRAPDQVSDNNHEEIKCETVEVNQMDSSTAVELVSFPIPVVSKNCSNHSFNYEYCSETITDIVQSATIAKSVESIELVKQDSASRSAVFQEIAEADAVEDCNNVPVSSSGEAERSCHVIYIEDKDHDDSSNVQVENSSLGELHRSTVAVVESNDANEQQIQERVGEQDFHELNNIEAEEDDSDCNSDRSSISPSSRISLQPCVKTNTSDGGFSMEKINESDSLSGAAEVVPGKEVLATPMGTSNQIKDISSNQPSNACAKGDFISYSAILNKNANIDTHHIISDHQGISSDPALEIPDPEYIAPESADQNMELQDHNNKEGYDDIVVNGVQRTASVFQDQEIKKCIVKDDEQSSISESKITGQDINDDEKSEEITLSIVDYSDPQNEVNVEKTPEHVVLDDCTEMHNSSFSSDGSLENSEHLEEGSEVATINTDIVDYTENKNKSENSSSGSELLERSNLERRENILRDWSLSPSSEEDHTCRQIENSYNSLRELPTEIEVQENENHEYHEKLDDSLRGTNKREFHENEERIQNAVIFSEYEFDLPHDLTKKEEQENAFIDASTNQPTYPIPCDGNEDGDERTNKMVEFPIPSNHDVEKSISPKVEIDSNEENSLAVNSCSSDNNEENQLCLKSSDTSSYTEESPKTANSSDASIHESGCTCNCIEDASAETNSPNSSIHEGVPSDPYHADKNEDDIEETSSAITSIDQCSNEDLRLISVDIEDNKYIQLEVNGSQADCSSDIQTFDNRVNEIEICNDVANVVATSHELQHQEEPCFSPTDAVKDGSEEINASVNTNIPVKSPAKRKRRRNKWSTKKRKTNNQIQREIFLEHPEINNCPDLLQNTNESSTETLQQSLIYNEIATENEDKFSHSAYLGIHNNQCPVGPPSSDSEVVDTGALMLEDTSSEKIKEPVGSAFENGIVASDAGLNICKLSGSNSAKKKEEEKRVLRKRKPKDLTSVKTRKRRKTSKTVRANSLTSEVLDKGPNAACSHSVKKEINEDYVMQAEGVKDEQKNESSCNHNGTERGIDPKLIRNCVMAQQLNPYEQETERSFHHTNSSEILIYNAVEGNKNSADISDVVTMAVQDNSKGTEMNDNEQNLNAVGVKVEPTTHTFLQNDEADKESFAFETVPNTDDVETDVDDDVCCANVSFSDTLAGSVIYPERTVNFLDTVINNRIDPVDKLDSVQFDTPSFHVPVAVAIQNEVPKIEPEELQPNNNLQNHQTENYDYLNTDQPSVKIKRQRNRVKTVPTKEYNTRKKRSTSRKNTKINNEKPVKQTRVRHLPVLTPQGTLIKNESTSQMPVSSLELQDVSVTVPSPKIQMPTLLPAPSPSLLPTPSVSASVAGQPNMPSLLRAPASKSKPNLLPAFVRGPPPDQGQILGVMTEKHNKVKQPRKRRATNQEEKPGKKSKKSDISCRNSPNEEVPPVLSKPDENAEMLLERENCVSPVLPVLQPEI